VQSSLTINNMDHRLFTITYTQDTSVSMNSNILLISSINLRLDIASASATKKSLVATATGLFLCEAL
jgi:hypothetical protein